ncbi:hypothetical protein O4H49_18610 [Kiloniella laminariae]|uniref:Solute-binding protein family 3/N-terminal domain-containing protein n=1 Tax=Kiloniella laminariae TaxID=454162 RepID=A0ABT4LNT8_9PROT|nr:hypothetical protein [Kiloniella laminariae]MCZ4282803.1 hypothetical protein [Kiloniella laminariae]
MRLGAAALIFFLLGGGGAGASPADNAVACPKKIATVSQNKLSLRAQKIVEHVYHELGCPIEVVAFPGRRGIVSFNNRTVDGELYRLPTAEGLYERSFVKSDPLFMLSGYLWRRPGGVEKEPRIAYVLGFYWQEDFVKTRTAVAFQNFDAVIKAYEQGEVEAFLASDFLVRRILDEKKISVLPLRQERLEAGAFYHYLGEEYQEFMRRFSDYLDRHHPFADLEAELNGTQREEKDGLM